MTKTALDHHIRILNIAAKQSIEDLSSIYKLLSKYSHLKTELDILYVCRTKKCEHVLETGPDKYPKLKQSCGHQHVRNRSNDCMVIQLPIEKQLEYFLEHHGLKSSSEVPDADFRSDVNSGSCFRKLQEEGKIDARTITCQLNFDGARFHKLSRFGSWPFMALINEAKYGRRRSFIILLAVWWGDKKPPRDVFMDGTLKKLKTLETSGFTFKGQVYKLRVVIISVDTIARSGLMFMTQCNGECGCGFCLHPGEQIGKGRGSVRVYLQPDPEEDEDVGRETIVYALRTLDQHLRDANQALESQKRVNGIIGPNPFMKNLPDFDFVKALVPEYLHSCCHGVFRLYLQIFTSSKKPNGSKPWFLKPKKVKIINLRLKQTRPPYEITRTIEQLDDRSDWKASTYRTFTLYYFPLLEDQLPPRYFSHYCDLAYGIYTLLQEKISVSNIEKVKRLFQRFVIEMENLYGKEWIGINVHFLTHLAQCVLDWGGLWAWSTFIPEWFNGQLNNSANGTQHIALQMAQNFLISQHVRDEARDLIKNNKLPQNVVSLFSELLNLPKPRDLVIKGIFVNDDKVELLGRPDIRSITFEEEIAVKNAFGKDVNRLAHDCDIGNCKAFSRFQLKISSSIFTTTSYKRSPKRVNYCAFLKDGTFFFIDQILLIQNDFISRAFIVGRKMGVNSKKIYLPDPIDGECFSPIPGQTTKLFGLSKELFAYDPINIQQKLF